MFYPEESLRRGGKFYLCWVADSWPLRFASITHRQLWSHDIRKLCNDLLVVVTNESGRPANRFSLRLSSQLMRGLVRLYERKVTVFLSDLCMIHAYVFKSTNKKLTAHEVTARVHRPLQTVQQLPALEVEHEQRVEELLQNSGNVVSNIQDITLKEAVIPDFQQPKNDGFGEEQPEQALQVFSELGERSVEQMLGPRDVTGTGTVHTSALGLLDTTDKSHDKSKLVVHDLHAMETMAEQDVSLFRKSAGDGLWSTSAFEKDIPEIPEIPPPEVSAPKEPEKQVEVPPQEEVQPEIQPATEAQAVQPEPPAIAEPVPQNIELQELQEEPQVKRRRPKKLIVDKNTILSSNFLRSRIANPNVGLRCEDSSDDVIDVHVQWEVLRTRPAHAGCRLHSNMAAPLTRIFLRNLHPISRPETPWAETHVEEVIAEESTRRVTRASLAQIAEVEEPQEQPTAAPQPMVIPEVIITAPPQERESMPPLDISAQPPPQIEAEAILIEKEAQKEQELMDIQDLPTQKLESPSRALKRASAMDTSQAKRPRLSGYQSFRESQSLRQKEDELQPQIVEAQEVDKENVPPSCQSQPPPRDSIRHVSAMLQEAGLTDVHATLTEPVPHTEPQVTSQVSQVVRRKDDSDSSETPLGSLDRTKVSLGESAETTESQMLIRKHWGIEGTMVKIMYNVKAGVAPITVESLVARGPIIVGYRRLIAARCFTSLLKLYQHGFIRITKHEDSLEIKDIGLGPRFDGL